MRSEHITKYEITRVAQFIVNSQLFMLIISYDNYNLKIPRYSYSTSPRSYLPQQQQELRYFTGREKELNVSYEKEMKKIHMKIA